MKDFDTLENIFYAHSTNKIIPGLERITRLLDRLGNPQNSFRSLHIVGTNGKGSTGAFLSSVFTASGYRTGFYSSPHLASPGERLLVDGEALSPEKWIEAAHDVVSVMVDGEELPSYFELLTATAFVLMRRENIEVGIIEAGLGGKFDATNVLGRCACSVIASISIDHTEYLGSTLDSIAGEKFAVVKSGVPACFSGVDESLVPMFREVCREKKALPFVVSEGARVENVRVSPEGNAFCFRAGGLGLHDVHTGSIDSTQAGSTAPHTGLVDGVHVSNAKPLHSEKGLGLHDEHTGPIDSTQAGSTAPHTGLVDGEHVSNAKPLYSEKGLGLHDVHTGPIDSTQAGSTAPHTGLVDGVHVSNANPLYSEKGLGLHDVHTGLIGRYQVSNAALALSAVSCVMREFPKITEDSILAGMLNAKWPGRLEVVSREPLIVLDGGHNYDGVKKLCASVRELWPEKKFAVIYAAMRDKNFSGCLELLNTHLKPALYLTTVPGMDRAAKPDELLREAGKFTWDNSPVGVDVPIEAVNRALNDGCNAVIVCGSLYLIGYMKKEHDFVA